VEGHLLFTSLRVLFFPVSEFSLQSRATLSQWILPTITSRRSDLNWVFSDTSPTYWEFSENSYHWSRIHTWEFQKLPWRGIDNHRTQCHTPQDRRKTCYKNRTTRHSFHATNIFSPCYERLFFFVGVLRAFLIRENTLLSFLIAACICCYLTLRVAFLHAFSLLERCVTLGLSPLLHLRPLHDHFTTTSLLESFDHFTTTSRHETLSLFRRRNCSALLLEWIGLLYKTIVLL
jgi:hypothetical protein